MNSLYKSFSELNAVEKNGLAYQITVKNRRTACVVIAPHGGGIEPGTTELAVATAGWSFSLYTFDGIRPKGNELLHITSTRFDEPKCLKLIAISDIVFAIHGCGDAQHVVYVGGLDLKLGDQILCSLQSAGFHAIRATAQFVGNQPENICNRGKTGKGVQLEISEGLRHSMFKGLDREKRRETLPPFQKFVSAVQAVIRAQDTRRNDLWRLLTNNKF